jgi:hypothetical protein
MKTYNELKSWFSVNKINKGEIELVKEWCSMIDKYSKGFNINASESSESSESSDAALGFDDVLRFVFDSEIINRREADLLIKHKQK